MQRLLYGLGCVVAIIVIIGVVIFDHRDTVTVLHASRSSYHLEVADTPAAQQKGLGDRSSLAQDGGMLFTFSVDDQRCFWMLNMHFPLDIIWASGAKRVTHIEKNLSPATYPQQYCAPAKYVIELNAGQAARNNLQVGQTLDF